MKIKVASQLGFFCFERGGGGYLCELATGEKRRVCPPTELVEGEEPEASAPSAFFRVMLLSERKAPARYAAPQLRRRSDETQAELFGHSVLQQHNGSREDGTLTLEPLCNTEVRAARETAAEENVNRIIMVKRED